MTTTMAAELAAPPVAPHTLAEAGLSADLVQQLTMKTLHFAGELTGTELARRLGIQFAVLEPALEFLKVERLIEIAGGSMTGRASYHYRVTDAGRERAARLCAINQYHGVAPVPLAQYQAYMGEGQRAQRQTATRARVRSAFSHLVVGEHVLDQLGPAINAGHSILLYGPPGNGKTVISQAIRGLLCGDMMIPHALEVDGAIIRVFDPVNHEPIPDDLADEGTLQLDARAPDRRWIRCRRPLVMVGGELTLDGLDLRYGADTGIYHAPVQMIANGGVLIIDDFGRQACAPRDLLNRWIVPLESGVDYLTLQSGQKFAMPFMPMVVFATNIKPAELVDEAFLRRIHYKVYAESPTPSEFAQIFERHCRQRQLAFDPRLVEGLLQRVYEPRRIPLRGCQPRDLIDHALSLAEYLGAPRALTPELLDSAAAGYFVDDELAAPSQP